MILIMELVDTSYGKHVDQLSTWELEELHKIFFKNVSVKGRELAVLEK